MFNYRAIIVIKPRIINRYLASIIADIIIAIIIMDILMTATINIVNSRCHWVIMCVYHCNASVVTGVIWIEIIVICVFF